MSTCNSLQIPPIGSFISGQELDDLLLAGIKDKEETLTTHLSRFDGKDLFPKWLELMRCMDEFSTCVTHLDLGNGRRLVSPALI